VLPWPPHPAAVTVKSTIAVSQIQKRFINPPIW
jgi:hypothetical protein